MANRPIEYDRAPEPASNPMTPMVHIARVGQHVVCAGETLPAHVFREGCAFPFERHLDVARRDMLAHRNILEQSLSGRPRIRFGSSRIASARWSAVSTEAAVSPGAAGCRQEAL